MAIRIENVYAVDTGSNRAEHITHYKHKQTDQKKGEREIPRTFCSKWNDTRGYRRARTFLYCLFIRSICISLIEYTAC